MSNGYHRGLQYKSKLSESSWDFQGLYTSLREDKMDNFTPEHHQKKMQSEVIVDGFFFNICILCRLTNKHKVLWKNVVSRYLSIIFQHKFLFSELQKAAGYEVF